MAESELGHYPETIHSASAPKESFRQRVMDKLKYSLDKHAGKVTFGLLGLAIVQELGAWVTGYKFLGLTAVGTVFLALGSASIMLRQKHQEKS